MGQSLTDLDHLELNLSSGNLMLLNLILGFIMFGVAIGIDVSDFKLILKCPKMMWVGLLGQWLLLPALTVVLIWMMNNYLSPGMAMGMILVASCPGGNISNFMVHHARGNTALSVSLTAFSTLGALLFTPLNFMLWGTVYSKFISSNSENALLRELTIDPGEVAISIFLLLGLPLVVGMTLRKFRPQLTQRLQKPMRYASVIAFVTIIIVAFSKNVDSFITYIGVIFTVVLIHNACLILGGYLWARGFGLAQRERRSVALEIGIQNSGLGLVLLLNPAIFPSELPIGGMAAITAWWGIWHIVVGLSLSSFWRLKKGGASARA